MARRAKKGVNRRSLLIGGGVGAGLLVAWALWPRGYAPNLRAEPGETLFNAFLKIGVDGRVVVAVPQVELGQGVYTSLPQIVADELGADWRTVAVEPAPIGPLYANRLLAEQVSRDSLPSALQGLGRWAAGEYATRTALMITGGSTSIRAFEAPLREAGAGARALLMKAAAERWKVEWDSLETREGFVLNGRERLRFAELAERAAELDLPEPLPMRGGIEGRLTGQPLPRLDLPSKVDGSAQFAADIRLPDLVYASVRRGPIRTTRLVGMDREAAGKVPGVVALFEFDTWVAAVATNWWAANRAIEALKPVFRTAGGPSSASVEAALTGALAGGGARRFVTRGDAGETVPGTRSFSARYAAGPAPSAPMETLTATARFTGDRLEVWAPVQAPGLARAAAARAAGIGEGRVTLYPTLIGSGYGRKLEVDAVEQAVRIAARVKRPVQLVWSRMEETMQDRFRAPARAELTAKLAANGTIASWQARIAAPSTVAQLRRRLAGEAEEASSAEAAAVDGAAPPYAIPALAVDHLPAYMGLSAGVWRSGAHSYTAFFNECFVDELARQAKMEPFSFRMQMLGDNPRLARCLTTVTALGGWDGGQAGSSLGIAAHSAFGSHVATLVEATVDGSQRIRVTRALAAVDCGRIVNPEIVRQQIEGGIMFGIAGATANSIRFDGGLPSARGFGDLGLPTLSETPDVSIELIESEEPPGGVTELGVPTVAPAIANAIFALTGQRLRTLPLAIGGA